MAAAASTQHGSARSGWAAPTMLARSRGYGVAAGGGTDVPGTVQGSMQLQAREKPPTSGIWRVWGGCCPVAKQQLPAAPPPPGPGARRATWAAAGARVPLPEPGADGCVSGAAARRIPEALGSCALGLRFVCAKPGAWRPASPEESLARRQRRWAPRAPTGPASHAGYGVAPVTGAGDTARGLMEWQVGVQPLAPHPAPSRDRSLVPGEGWSDAARAGGSGDEPRIKAWVLGMPPLGCQTWGAGLKGASWDQAPWSCLEWGVGSPAPRLSPAASPCLALGHVPQSLCPRDVAIPARAVGIPMPFIPRGSAGRGTPQAAHTVRAKQPPPWFPGSQRAAPTLSRRLLLLNCANEMTLIKAIAPQPGDGCCRLSGGPQPQPCISTGRDEGPHCGDTVPEPSPGDMA